MKTPLFLLLLISLSLFANEASIFAKKLDYFNSYKLALLQAKEENKILMLVVVEDGCSWCKKFEKTTLQIKSIQNATKNFIRVIVDKHDAVPIFFQTSFVPVVFFINPKTQISMLEVIGYHNSKRFLSKIKQNIFLKRRIP